MAKKYTGSLTLEWFNKNRSIITQKAEQKRDGDIPAPRINWINKDEALFYEISEEEGKGLTPYWVDRNDIRVKESRPLVFQKAYKAVPEDDSFKVEESDVDDPEIENILIKGDNLLALNTLKKMFDQKPEDEKVQCVFIDPPYNTEQSFKHYEDNLEVSEWLTLMRDRITMVKTLIKNEGFFFAITDEKYHSYLKILCDEIFGIDNFLGDLIWQKRKGGGNDSTFIALDHDYILCYARNKQNPNHKEKYRIPYEGDYLKRYKETDSNGTKFYWDTVARDGLQSPILVDLDCPDGTKLNIKSQVSKDKILKSLKTGKMRLTKGNNGWTLHHRVYIPQKGKVLRSILVEQGTNKNSKDEQTLLSPDDKFDYPKPEKLLEYLLNFCTKENDLVLDSFLGSGTTAAVAKKMNRKWIGIEIGSHCETHCINRLAKVISGEDQGGISKNHDWKGGGSFKYYHLGESIISVKKDGYGDFNWSLGRDFIEKSLLATYDFILDEKLELPGSTIEQIPKVGFYDVNNYTMAGIVALASPGQEIGPLDNDYINELISAIRKYKSPQSITIFTNRGVEMAWESKPEDVEIIKVPHAIFVELER